MRIKEHIYIYYKNESDYIKLENVQNQLQDPVKNREKIIDDFKKKFKNDYIESAKKLLREGPMFMYPISTILTSGIDVLAKYYSGDTGHSGNKSRFIEFLEQRAPSLCYILSKEDIYSFRCGIVHSNSTKIEMVIGDISQDKLDRNIDLNFLVKELEKLLNSYVDSLRNEEQVYNDFISIYTDLYGN